MSAKEYEAQHGESRTAKRIETPEGVVYAVKQSDGSYKVWRMDQLLGTVMKFTRPAVWVAKTAKGKTLEVEQFSTMKTSIEQLQRSAPAPGSIRDVATQQYAEQLVRKHGAEEARDMTSGLAREEVELFIQWHP